MKAFAVNKGGSITAPDGDLIFMDFDRFRSEVFTIGHCFVCGRARCKDFNREHIIPDWMLRLCGLHNKEITLPNGVRTRYSTYRLRCCTKCNSRLGDEFERPIREVISAGFDRVEEYANSGGAELLQLWMALIFLKVHLRDRRVPVHRDQRLGSETVGEEYDLDLLHHVHALARARLFGIEVDPDVFGTFVIMRAHREWCPTTFNYADNYLGGTIMIRVKDVVLYSVIADCGLVGSMMGPQLDSLTNRMLDIQYLEVLTRLACANVHIISQPQFRTGIDLLSGGSKIEVKLPDKAEIRDLDRDVLGWMMEGTVSRFVSESVGANLRTGHSTTLWDANGDTVEYPKPNIDPEW
ncbi:HNH endonuclease [Mesorhizobium sp. M0621]|uniref:hypothetical protein n=1 Tax=Mesorhizobium sp. M0621 TaxID=2956974 RepID=UPI00333DC993